MAGRNVSEMTILCRVGRRTVTRSIDQSCQIPLQSSFVAVGGHTWAIFLLGVIMTEIAVMFNMLSDGFPACAVR